jgi:hypothetical protein
VINFAAIQEKLDKDLNFRTQFLRDPVQALFQQGVTLSLKQQGQIRQSVQLLPAVQTGAATPLLATPQLASPQIKIVVTL